MGCTKLRYLNFSQALENNDLYCFLSIDNTPYRFNGKEIDPETGNQYYGARYYDPKISVWLSVDPLIGNNPSLSPYNFVSNSPIHRIDPDGKDDHEWDLLPGGSLVYKSDKGGDETDYVNIVDGKGCSDETIVLPVQSTVFEVDNPIQAMSDPNSPKSGPGQRVQYKETGLTLTFDLVDVVLGAVGGHFLGKGLGWLGSKILSRTTSKTLSKAVEKLLKPSGELIGTQAARNPLVRTVTNKEAQAVIDGFMKQGAKAVEKASYKNGTWYELPGGGGFGIRHTVGHTSTRLGSTGAIDINIMNIPINNLKF